MKKNLFLVLFFIFFLYGCGGGGAASSSGSNIDGNNPIQNEPVIYTAYLEDSPTEGIEYRCGTLSGLTGSDGSFKYTNDCTVEFSIGKMFLGEINATLLSDSLKVYPTDILGFSTKDINQTKVSLLTQWLQSLDSDQNTTNRITISSSIHDILTNRIDINSLDFKNGTINEDDLNIILQKIYPTRSLISSTTALNHLKNTMESNDLNLSTINPSKPTFVNPNTLLSITNHHISTKVQARKFKIKGEPGTSIWYFLDTNGTTIPTDGNYTALNNQKITNNGYQDITLRFDTPTVTEYHYYVKLKDNYGNFSEATELWITSDTIPPHVNKSTIAPEVLEEQNLVIDINATDTSGIKEFRIVSNEGEDNDSRSIDYKRFDINKTTGLVTFSDPYPNFDDSDERNHTFTVVARAIDIAGNMTDVPIYVRLKNILDNPPMLINNLFYKNVIEHPQDGSADFYYDLNSTLASVIVAPDNNVSEFPMKYKLTSYTHLFNIDEDTGRVTIQNGAHSNFNFEEYPDYIFDLNFTIENENNVTANILYQCPGENNKSCGTLRVTLQNKIDTSPVLLQPATPKLIPEKVANNNFSSYAINFNNQLDLANSDSNTSNTEYYIISGDDNHHFVINKDTGILEVNTSNSLNYEVTREYNLTIQAKNTWYDNTTHLSNSVVQTINISNVVDIAPTISLTTPSNISIAENTNPNYPIANLSTSGNIIDGTGIIHDENNVSIYQITSIKKNNDSIDIGSSPFNEYFADGNLTTNRHFLDSSDYIENIDGNDTIYQITVKATNYYWNDTTIQTAISNAEDINVSIRNVIDNAPVISTTSTPLMFDENTSTPIGSVIYDVNTSGTIYDENNVTAFSIVSGNVGNKFTIDNLGVIRLANLLDWETTDTYTLGIQASNIHWDGSEHNSSIQNLTINVNNMIESPPSITGPTTLNIHENIDIGEVIASIEINSTEEDKKTVDNFIIVNGNIGDKFELSDKKTDDVTGLEYVELKIKNTLDYETKSSYTLEINATNEHNSTTHTIDINVTDDIEKDLPLLIIAIEYDDINFTTTLASIENLIFKEENPGSKYLKNYFERVSKGKFYFKAATENYISSPETFGIIKVKLPRNHPQNATSGLDIDIKDALIVADNNITFSSFDTNHDGNISSNELQMLCIVAGGERTYLDTNKSILAKTDSFGSTTNPVIAPILDGVKVASNDGGGNFAVVGEKQNDHTLTIGLVAKMLSQSALGFKLQGDSYTFSDFDLMGSGYNGYENTDINGTMPVHPSVYNKIRQGWTTPTTLKKNRTYSNVAFTYANSVIAYNTYKIEDSSDSNIYYLLEYRDSSPIGTAGNNYDNGLYKINNATFSGGLRVWKVNNNSGASKILEPVTIANTTDNIFRITNGTTDLPSNSAFEFTDVGAINTSNNTYSIGIKTK